MSYLMKITLITGMSMAFPFGPRTMWILFWICSLPGMFLTLDVLLEYWIKLIVIGCLDGRFAFSTRIFYREVLGFVTDCPCGVCGRGLPTCFLYVSPIFGNHVLQEQLVCQSWHSKRRFCHWFCYFCTYTTPLFIFIIVYLYMLIFYFSLYFRITVGALYIYIYI